MWQPSIFFRELLFSNWLILKTFYQALCWQHRRLKHTFWPTLRQVGKFNGIRGTKYSQLSCRYKTMGQCQTWTVLDEETCLAARPWRLFRYILDLISLHWATHSNRRSPLDCPASCSAKHLWANRICGVSIQRRVEVLRSLVSVR